MTTMKAEPVELLAPDTASRDARRMAWIRASVVAVSLAVIAVSYAEIPVTAGLASYIARYLFFLPIVMAALWFGWRGGLVTSVIAAAAYLPNLLMWWTQSGYSTDAYGEAFDLVLVGSVLGVLADRERRKANQLRQTTFQLSATYRQLQESLEHLKQAERLSAVGQLAANLAHEIRNPLASIEGAAELIRPGELPPEQQNEFVQIIRKESRRLSRLLTDMLDYARPRPAAMRPVSIAQVIGGVTSLAGVAAQKAGVAIEADVPGDLPAVSCDSEQIKQVLFNLVINAVQAMPNGGRLTVSARAQKNSLVVSVRDEGPGVDPRSIDKIFSPFYTTKKAGTGLGLAVAQQIVAAHGGEISVESNTPSGAVFSIRLHLEPETEPSQVR